MPRTESISIFNATNIAKNASTNSNLVDLKKCGPNTKFYGDFNASGGGTVDVVYKVGLTPTDTFYIPSASIVCLASFLSSIGNASRDLRSFTIKRAPWVKFMAKECNASPVNFSMNLIVVQD